LGLTQEEVDEVVHVAMTVGASRLKVMADSEVAAHPLAPEAEARQNPAAEEPTASASASESPAAEPVPASPQAVAQPAPVFAASPVDSDAGGG
jgi:hypothetical protein